eukprot:COSAG06_NODE_417_length_15986_cov_832.025493_3_plen_65_part_00
MMFYNIYKSPSLTQSASSLPPAALCRRHRRHRCVRLRLLGLPLPVLMATDGAVVRGKLGHAVKA